MTDLQHARVHELLKGRMHIIDRLVRLEAQEPKNTKEIEQMKDLLTKLNAKIESLTD